MSVPFDPSSHSHRRWNPLQKQWILCSPHRTKRPWQGQFEPPQIDSRPEYDPKCYLCPGNDRAGGQRTDNYDSTYIFENDFAALVEDAVDPTPTDSDDPDLFASQTARGKCYVICFSPRHDLTIAEMSDKEIATIIDVWRKLYKDVSSKYDWINYIQIFENKGAMMGCSNPHPHGQAWSLSYIPTIPQTILSSLKEYALSKKPKQVALKNGKAALLLDYARAELNRTDESRVVVKGSHFAALVPFWASWPFEVLVLPYNRHVSHLLDLNEEEVRDLAFVMGATTRRMDNLFQCSFAYSMGIYQAPVYRTSYDSADDLGNYAQFHIGFYPPLLRSSTVRKFLVGFELFAETQRDITPERAANRLREQSNEHYKKQAKA